MTKRLSNAYREALLDGTAPDLTAVNVKQVALDATHVDDVNDDFLDDITGGSTIATSANLANKTIVDGYFDSDPAVFTAVAGGDTITQFWKFYDTGTPATSMLIAYMDEDANGDPYSIATNGEDINHTPHASGWFRV